MKILMVSMNSIHFSRWTEQLRDSDHEIHWFNIRSGALDTKLDFVTQHTHWRYRISKGRSWIKKIPLIKTWNERDPAKAFEKVLKAVQPDVVHSFALYVSAAPIRSVMKSHPDIKWILSTWGSDLFYFKEVPEFKSQILATLPHITHLFTDCDRDHDIARKLGFTGTHLGTFPGGGGYPVQAMQSLFKHKSKSNIILVKGNQDRSGRSVNVLKALAACASLLQDWEVMVFNATDAAVLRFTSTWLGTSRESKISKIKIYGPIGHDELLSLMGKAKIYIGNSNSDGTPNTMLEAIICGAYPIQSNPGGATSEWITSGQNGLLIEDCEDIAHITELIKKALSDEMGRAEATAFNQKYLVPKLQRSLIKDQVLKAYARLRNA